MKTLYKIIMFCTLLFSANVVFAQQTEREKGIELYNKGKYQSAVETLQEVVKTDQEDKKAWLYLGMSQARLKKQSQAEKSFKKADKISVKNKESSVTAVGVKIISKPRAPYTDSARMNQTQGIVELAVEFGADGTIKGVFPFRQLPYGLTENCVESAKNIKFEPATKDGKAYSTIGILTYTFTIY